MSSKNFGFTGTKGKTTEGMLNIFFSLPSQLTSEQEAKTNFKPNDFNETIVLQHMTEILDSADMKTHNSVFLFNLGVHFSVSLNFTTYRHLIDNIVKLVKRKTFEKNENTAIPIWKTTTSIEKENVHKMYAELPRNITHWRFHTHQVKSYKVKSVYEPSGSSGWSLSQFQ